MPFTLNFTYDLASQNLTTPPVYSATVLTSPARTYSEIGTSALNDTIDQSQVDFFSFPMNTLGVVTANTPANPTMR